MKTTTTTTTTNKRDKTTNYITPNWEPLEDLNKIYPELFNMEDFMWMHTSNGIECYKHRLMRNYINIDSNGNFWKYTNLQAGGGGGKYGYINISGIEARRNLRKMNKHQQEFNVACQIMRNKTSAKK